MKGIKAASRVDTVWNDNHFGETTLKLGTI